MAAQKETPPLPSRALNDPAEIPRELNRWNWGAFLLNWIWGIGNSTFIALLMFVPVVNLVMIFVLGAKGSRWAWRNRAWRDADHFRRSQRSWAIAGFVIWALAIGGTAWSVTSLPRLMKSTEAYHMTMDAVRGDLRVRATLGANIRDGFWVGGAVHVEGGGTGAATYRIPVHGDKAAGTVVSSAVKNGGKWTIRLLYVTPDGKPPIVLINEDEVRIPGAAMPI
jgi:hypothetical protein